MNDAVKEEYLKRAFNAIISNAELENIEPGIGKFTLERAFNAIISNAELENIEPGMGEFTLEVMLS